MGSRARGLAAPIYLLLCLVLGGSGQGIWANMVLQLAGLALIAWAALTRTGQDFTIEQRQLLGIVLLALGLVAIQLVPLPPAIWPSLGGREAIAEGYRTLGLSQPWLPLSVAPYSTLASLLALIPPLAMLVATMRLGARRLWLVIALVIGLLAGIVLGAMQVSSPDPNSSPWYLYDDTNFGVATGFFANANHMATLLVATLPFLAAVLASARAARANLQRYSAAVALVGGVALVIAVGIALNGSLAGAGLSVPVLLASASIIFRRGRRALGWLLPVSALLLVVAAGWLATTPPGSSGAFRIGAATSVQSREEIMSTTLEATKAFMPLGSGVGSFEAVYALHEDPGRLDPTTYVNHAHNDYLEIALETGVPGLLLILLFLIWWGKAAWRTWRVADASPYAQAASIASAAILVHSLVDFPLRTAAIGALFAMCLAILVRPRRARELDKSKLWPTRHVVAG